MDVTWKTKIVMLVVTIILTAILTGFILWFRTSNVGVQLAANWLAAMEA